MDRAPIGRTIALNPGFVDALSPEQLDGYVKVLIEAARQHPGHDIRELSKVIEEGLVHIGIRMAPVELERTAEQLVGHGDARLAITTTDGRVIFDSLTHTGS